MALVGTISGSNGTSNTAITGTLVIANVSAGFPSIPSDSILYAQGTAVATGDLVASGNLKSMFSGGDEGGELFLNKATTNTTLNIGVTIDVNQNRLRIFETGGTNRGGYFDVSALSAGVGTNLAAGGGATPGGSNTHIQFNNGGSFGGNSSLTFDQTNGIIAAANLLVTGTAESLETSGSIVAVGSIISSGSFIVKDIGGISTAVIASSGDITGSNLKLNGDIAVVGGDLTTTAASFNLVTGSNTIRIGANPSSIIVSGTIDTSGSAAITLVRAVGGDIAVASSTGKLLLGPTGQNQQIHNNSNYEMTNTTGHILFTNNALNQRFEVAVTGSTSAGMFRVRRYTGTVGSRIATDMLEVRNDGTVLIGSASTGTSFLGTTTISNDLFLSSGRIAVNTDTTPIELVSSGNVTIKLDANNNATGHFFAVQDFNGISQFTVREEGIIQIERDLVVTASTEIGIVSERLFTTASAGAVLGFGMGNRSIFYVNNATSNITANFTSVPITNNRVITPTVILSQSGTPRIVSAVQIDGTGSTINWVNGVTPTGNANKHDVFGFSLIRSGGLWTVLGQMSTYG